MGGSGSSPSASTGGGWTSTLYYTPNAEKPGTNPIEIDDDDVIEYFQKVKGTGDQILKAWIYKQNLSKVVPKAAQLWHEFLVVESTDWYWSFEKDTECIRVQRSKDEDSVVYYYRGGKRSGTVDLEQSPCKGMKGDRIQHIFETLYKEHHLNDGYHVLNSNCQDFASDVYDAIRYNSIPFDH